MESCVSSCERPERSITTALTGMSRKIWVDSASRDMGDFLCYGVGIDLSHDLATSDRGRWRIQESHYPSRFFKSLAFLVQV